LTTTHLRAVAQSLRRHGWLRSSEVGVREAYVDSSTSRRNLGSSAGIESGAEVVLMQLDTTDCGALLNVWTLGRELGW
jgi:phosphopantothenate synthetase